MFMSLLSRRAWLVIGVVLSLWVVAPAQAESLQTCGFSTGNTVNGDSISRGFYLINYPGQSLRTLKLRHSATVTGTYSITVTARAGSFSGAVIGEPYTATVVLGANSSVGVDVLYELGDMPVTPGSTVTFSMTATGPGTVFYDVGVPAACANVTETEDTGAPLSAFRRDRVGFEVFGRKVTQTFYSCGFAAGGDGLSRGVYITNYPGETLRKVTFRYESFSTGNRTIRLTARQEGYNGSVIGSPQTQTIAFTAGSANGGTIDWDFGGAFVTQGGTIAFTHEILSGGTDVYRGNASGVCSGVVSTESTSGTLDTTRTNSGILVTGDREAGYRKVIEYYIPSLNHYFISGRPNEQALLAQYPSLYQATGATFLGFPSTGAPQGSVPICRFYLPPSAGGPNSHFYGQPTDCNAIIALANPAFQFEGYDFAMYTPSATATCPSYAPNKVYRSFNNRAAVNDGNHRYTTALSTYNAMVSGGWSAEGAVFCSDTTTP
jgi:hypothetical protein